jgi:hypothetical protein
MPFPRGGQCRLATDKQCKVAMGTGSDVDDTLDTVTPVAGCQSQRRAR